MSTSTSALLTAAAAAAAGICSHIFIFKRPEYDKHAVETIYVLGSLSSLLPFYLSSRLEYSLLACLKLTATIGGVYVFSVFASIAVYRLFFHPLRSFPGPVAARVSKFWAFWKTLETGMRFHEVTDDLHRKYGDFVRSGPREIMVFDIKALPLIHGVTSKATKGPWYDMVGAASLHGMRDKEMHQKRRKIWDQAFSMKALAEFSPVVESYTSTLLEQLTARQNTIINATEWLNFYSYDVMSAMAFGSSLNMMKDGKASWVLKNIHGSLKEFATYASIPWIFSFVMKIPVLLKDFYALSHYSKEQVEKRRKMCNPSPDLFKYLIMLDEGKPPTPESEILLATDSRLVITAGSDTTASALALSAFYLARFPVFRHELQEKLDEIFTGSEQSYDCMKKFSPHLEGLINEVLRLHPGVPGGVPRLTPPEGMTINGRWIPGGTDLIMPNYSIARDERYFVKPLEFIPERWYSQPDLVKNNNASFPFSTGPYGCVGKSLAMMELRSVIARVFREFDVSFVEGFDPDTWLRNIKDTFTTSLPELKLVFTKRV